MLEYNLQFFADNGDKTEEPTDKKLTATFPDDDIDYIVGLIETALDIQITVER